MDGRNEAGFTLLELIVVVVILGVLAAITIPSFLAHRQRAWTAELTSVTHHVALSVHAEAAGRSGWFVGARGAFPDEAAFDAFVDAALTQFIGPDGVPVTYDAGEGSATVDAFRLCLEHERLPTTSVSFDSDGGGLLAPVDATC